MRPWLLDHESDGSRTSSISNLPWHIHILKQAYNRTMAPRPVISADRIQQENEVTASFFRVLQARVDQVAQGQGSSQFELEEPERQVLLRINNSGLLKGAAAGILSLVFLRRVRSSVYNRVMQRVQQQQPGGSSHVGNSPFQNNPIPPLSTNTPLENALRRRQNPYSLPNILGWFLDTSVSFFVGATTSVLLTDRAMVLQSVSTLPLLQGKSRVAAELCPSMVQHYRELMMNNAQGNAKSVLQDPQTDYLKAIRAFSINCQRRQKQEASLRATMGMDANAVVSIPPPGVTVSEDDEDLWKEEYGGSSGSSQGRDDSDGDFYDLSPESDSTQWADDFALDQEEDNRRGR